MSKFILFVLGAVLVLASPVFAAEEVVTIGGARALLDKPAGAPAGIILVAGGDGNLAIGADGKINRLSGNQLVRTRRAYRAAGLAVLTVDLGVDLGAAVQYMRGIVKSVTLAGTSRGTVRIAQAIAAGARPDAVASSVPPVRCRARSWCIIARTLAGSRCPARSSRSCNGAAARRGWSGSAAGLRRAMCARHTRTTASTGKTGKSSRSWRALPGVEWGGNEGGAEAARMLATKMCVEEKSERAD
jgi:hypothetical protein